MFISGYLRTVICYCVGLALHVDSYTCNIGTEQGEQAQERKRGRPVVLGFCHPAKLFGGRKEFFRWQGVTVLNLHTPVVDGCAPRWQHKLANASVDSATHDALAHVLLNQEQNTLIVLPMWRSACVRGDSGNLTSSSTPSPAPPRLSPLSLTIVTTERGVLIACI